MAEEYGSYDPGPTVLSSGGEFAGSILGDVKSLANRVESLEKVTNGETIVMPDGSEYSMGDFGYADTAIDVFVQDDPPTGLNSSTDVGDRWYDTNDNYKLYVWDGLHWVLIATGEVYFGGLGLEALGPALTTRGLTNFTIYVQGTAPSSPTHGTIWKDTASGNAIKYWDTTNPAQWVTINDQNTINAVNNALGHSLANISDGQLSVFYMDAAPGGRNSTTNLGDRWYDTDDKYKGYIWNGTTWQDAAGGTQAAETDGSPPAYSPTPVVDGGIGSLFVSWDAVPNNDMIWYNLYVSATTPVGLTNATFAGTQYGTFAAITTLPDGTPFASNTTYYVVIIAVDADGPAAPSPEGSGQVLQVDLAGLEESIQTSIANIDTAQTTADSKNTIYFQAAEPTGGTYKIDDMWFETDNGYKPYRWTGSVWQGVPLGTAAIATGAVTAATIAAGAITADKLSANVITADAIKIGSFGTSLVMNNSFEVASPTDSLKPAGWYKAEGTGTTWDRLPWSGAAEGTHLLRITSANLGIGSKAFPLVPNKRYTFRYRAMGLSTANTYSVRINYSDVEPPSGVITDTTRTGTINLGPMNHPASWNSVETSFVASTNAKWGSFCFVNETGSLQSLYIDAVDVQEQASSVMIADGAILAQKIGADQVQANHILAGAIVAGKIAANAVSAGNIQAGAINAGHIQAGVIDASKITANAITSEKIASGALNSKYIYGSTLEAGSIYSPYLSGGNIYATSISSSTITSTNITGGLFKSSGGGQRIELGDTGLNDPVDELRMFNNGYVSSMRNMTGYAGSVYFSMQSRWGSNSIMLRPTTDGHVIVQRGTGGVNLKFLGTGLQARGQDDIGYSSIGASAFNVSSRQEFKQAIQPVSISFEELKGAGLKKWRWRPDFIGPVPPELENDPDVVQYREEFKYGLIADELPEWLQEGDGYSVTAVTAFLWETCKKMYGELKNLEDKVIRLEGGPNGPVTPPRS